MNNIKLVINKINTQNISKPKPIDMIDIQQNGYIRKIPHNADNITIEDFPSAKELMEREFDRLYLLG